MSDLAPIVIFTYRRIPIKLIESLRCNKISKYSILYIFSDGYKNETDKEDVLKVRKFIKNVDGFKETNVVERKRNYGLSSNIINGVITIIRKFGKIIVLEDDLVVSEDFLEYMNEALSFYKNDKKVWSISGYSPPLKCLKSYNKDVFLAPRVNSWGWATWKDRWENVDWDIKDWNNFKKSKDCIRRFNLGGNDLYKMLELQMLGKIDSWAIRWCYNQYKYGAYTLYPKYSKVKNIGFDSLGTHNDIRNDKWFVDISNKKVKFEHVCPDKEVISCFKNYYDLSFYSRIGYFLRKYGGYNIAKKIIRMFNLK